MCSSDLAAGLGNPKGLAYAGMNLYGGLGVDIEADLKGGDSEGKIRLYEGLSKIFASPTGIFDVLGIKGDLNLVVGGGLKAQFNTDPSTGLSNLDPALATILTAYNAAANLAGWTKEFIWNPSVEFKLPLAGFDSSKTSFFIA